MSNKENNIILTGIDMTDEFAVRDALREKAKDIKTFDDLVTFLEFIKNNCNTDYGTAPRSMAQAALAVAWYLSGEFGITGFQAGFVMWDFIKEWMYTGNTCGLKLVDYDDMLYPQHDYKFGKTISENTWKSLQEQAAKNLKYRIEHAHPTVIAHWQSIVDGNIPFGYSIKED